MVVDDDDVDRNLVLAYLSSYSFIEVTGAFESPVAGLKAASSHPPDCLFLDIDMDEMSGLELRRRLMEIPACVFITSYPDYALEGFEMAALDYLVKPFTSSRFASTIQRLQELVETRRRSDRLSDTIGSDTIFVKDGHKQVKLALHDVLYLEAFDNYTAVVTSERKYMILSPLSRMLSEGPFSAFIRIHRGFAVQKHYICRLSADEVELTGGIKLPLGRTYKESLRGLPGRII